MGKKLTLITGVHTEGTGNRIDRNPLAVSQNCNPGMHVIKLGSEIQNVQAIHM